MDWFLGLGTGEAAFCRPTQLSTLRLLTSPAVNPQPLSASVAWRILEHTLTESRVTYLTEPARWNIIFPLLLTYSVPTPKLVADAYLAVFALAGGYTLTTFDSGFTQYPGLQLHLL